MLGRILFKADDSAGNASTFARIEVVATDVTNGSEDARMEFYTAVNDAFTPTLNLVGGEVGIGTTGPGATLDLRGHMRLDSGGSTSRSIYFRNQDTSATGGGQVRSDQHLSLWAGNGGGTPTQYFTIKPGGNVGIGTTNPSFPLSVQADSNAEAILVLGRSADDIGEIAFRENDNSTKLGELQYRQGYGILRHRVGYLSFETGGATERMRIDSNGDVGIGTTPYANARLTIGGTESGGYPAVLQLDNNNTSGAEFFMLATDTNWSFGANKFIMGHGAPSSSNVDFSIDSAGLVGVGPYAPNDSGGFGVALDIGGSGGGALYLTDNTDNKQGTIGMWDSNLSIHSRPSDGEISFYVSNDKQFKVMANGTFQAEDQNNRSAAIISPTNVVHTGAYPQHPDGTGVGNNQTNQLQIGFCHIYNRNWSGGRYMHMKTDIPCSGSNYGMVMVFAKGYRYSPGGTIDSSWGFHNWGGAIYSLDQRNYATTFAVNCYDSSDNYVVLVGDNQSTSTATYTGFQLSFMYSNTNYPAHTQTVGGFSHKVTATSLSSSTSGVY